MDTECPNCSEELELISEEWHNITDISRKLPIIRRKPLKGYFCNYCKNYYELLSNDKLKLLN